MLGTGEVLVREWMTSMNGRVPHPMSLYAIHIVRAVSSACTCAQHRWPLHHHLVTHLRCKQHRSVPSAHIPTPALIHTAHITRRPPCPTSITTGLGSWGIVLVHYTAYNIQEIAIPQAHSLSVQGSRVPADRESDMEIATDRVTAYASGARTVLRFVPCPDTSMSPIFLPSFDANRCQMDFCMERRGNFINSTYSRC